MIVFENVDVYKFKFKHVVLLFIKLYVIIIIIVLDNRFELGMANPRPFLNNFGAVRLHTFKKCVYFCAENSLFCEFTFILTIRACVEYSRMPTQWMYNVVCDLLD